MIKIILSFIIWYSMKISKVQMMNINGNQGWTAQGCFGTRSVSKNAFRVPPKIFFLRSGVPPERLMIFFPRSDVPPEHLLKIFSRSGVPPERLIDFKILFRVPERSVPLVPTKNLNIVYKNNYFK